MVDDFNALLDACRNNPDGRWLPDRIHEASRLGLITPTQFSELNTLIGQNPTAKSTTAPSEEHDALIASLRKPSSSRGPDPSIGIPFSRLSLNDQTYVFACVSAAVAERESRQVLNVDRHNKDEDKAIEKIAPIIKPYLLEDETIIYCTRAKVKPADYDVVIKRGRNVSLLEVEEDSISNAHSFSQQVFELFITKGIELFLEDDIADKDVLFYDLHGNNSVRVLMQHSSLHGGFAARSVKLVKVSLFASKEKIAERALVIKTDKDGTIAFREKAMLDGIRQNSALRRMRITSPYVYGVKGARICMEFIEFPSVFDILKDAGVPDSLKSSLKSRVEAATVVIEKSTKSFLSRLFFDPEVERRRTLKRLVERLSETLPGVEDYLQNGRAKLEQNLLSVQQQLDRTIAAYGDSPIFKVDREEDQKTIAIIKAMIERFDAIKGPLQKQVEAARRFILQAREGMKKRTFSPQLATSFFDAVKPVETVARLGEEHRKAIQFLVDKGLFDTPISDSRFSNWLYDVKTDTLYKIDENIVEKGSIFTHFSKHYDYNDTLPIGERNQAIYQSYPEMEKELIHLSLYLSNLEAALSHFEIGNHDVAVRRLERAYHDLIVLVKLSTRWKPLIDELDAYKSRTISLNQDAQARAA